MYINIMQESFFLGLIVLPYFLLPFAEATFTIEDRFPPSSNGGENIFIKREGRLILSCSSSEEFNLCQWARPDSVPCGILNSEQDKICKKDNRVSGMSGWSIKKEGHRKCILTIDSVKDTEVGDWHCRLESLPYKGGAKSSKTEEFRVRLLEPAKVTLDGSMELTFRSGSKESATCSAVGSPTPIKLEWYLNNQPLRDVKIELDETSRENELKEKIATIFPADANRLECKAVQKDAMENEITSK